MWNRNLADDRRAARCTRRLWRLRHRTATRTSTSPSTSPPTSVPQPPALTFTERERAPREFAAKDALTCLRGEGLTVALPSGFPGADDVRPARQPFDPTISGPALERCRAEMVAYLEVAPPGPGPVALLMARYDCMANQGFIDAFPSPDTDREQYGQAQAFCSGIAPSNASQLSCDAYRVGADGTMETAPIRADLEQLITVEGTAPATSTVGTPFVVTIRPYDADHAADALRLHGGRRQLVRPSVHGGRGLDRPGFRPDRLPPTEPDVAVSTESDGTTATFRYDSVVPATESIEFPEATFEVTPSAPGRVVITFSGYEQSITFDVDGDQRVVRTICTSRFGTPVAWSTQPDRSDCVRGGRGWAATTTTAPKRLPGWRVRRSIGPLTDSAATTEPSDGDDRRTDRRDARLAFADALDPSVAADLAGQHPASRSDIEGEQRTLRNDPAQTVGRLERQHTATLLTLAHEELHALSRVVAELLEHRTCHVHERESFGGGPAERDETLAEVEPTVGISSQHAVRLERRRQTMSGCSGKLRLGLQLGERSEAHRPPPVSPTWPCRARRRPLRCPYRKNYIPYVGISQGARSRHGQDTAGEGLGTPSGALRTRRTRSAVHRPPPRPRGHEPAGVRRSAPHRPHGSPARPHDRHRGSQRPDRAHRPADRRPDLGQADRHAAGEHGRVRHHQLPDG